MLTGRRRVLDKMSPTAMANHAAVLCLLLFAGRLAAASKTFSTAAATGGGYSTPSEPAPSSPADSTAPKDESYGTPTQATPSESVPSTGQSETQPSGEGSASPATDQTYGGASPESSEPTTGLNEKAINDIVNEHNIFRAKEHVPPLKWNATLAKFSQQYAEQLKGECKMVHSTSPYGENLMLGTGGITWKTTVDVWSAEKESYHYGPNTCDPGKMCGHYTAVVWKGTTGVGCGRVLCNNGDTMIVCSYWPPGNYDGVRPF
ncbi:pathogenesis-related protein 1-like [Phragmites australis]|uniref:pathogenesis-related protein 1-like n=1 Tax=Phragmites australis TaxID=29695 RepID=UPI002D78BB59|nr:pathogenesis-related protein 1-like [Phragmites australis]